MIRRAERRISQLATDGEIAGEALLHFVNRASDLAYAMARFADVADPVLFEGRRRGAMTRVVARRRKGFTHDITLGEPQARRGRARRPGRHRRGPSPTRLLAASLAACTAITIEMYAERKEWDLDDVEVEVEPDTTARRRRASR